MFSLDEICRVSRPDKTTCSFGFGKREHLMGVTLAFDRAYGTKKDNSLDSVTVTKVIANDDDFALPMAA